MGYAVRSIKCKKKYQVSKNNGPKDNSAKDYNFWNALIPIIKQMDFNLCDSAFKRIKQWLFI